MVKRLVTVAVVLVVAGGSLFSQGKPGGVARMIALGGGMPSNNIVVNPFVFDDPVFSLVNPAYIANYKDYLWTNVAGGATYGGTSEGNGFQFTGVNFSIMKELTIGVDLSYDPTQFTSLRGILNTFITSTGYTTNPRALVLPQPRPEIFEVMAALQTGGMKLGLGVMYGWNNSDFTTNDSTPAVIGTASLGGHVLGLRAGLLMDLGGGNALDGSAIFRTERAHDNEDINRNGSRNYSISGTEFLANARLRLKISNRFSAVPYGAFMSVSREPKQDDVPTGATKTNQTYTDDLLGFAVGAGGELKTPSFYLAGGVSFVYLRETIDLSDSTIALGKFTDTQKFPESMFPVFNLGAEWWFTDWLAGRVGYFRAFMSTGSKHEHTNAFTPEFTRLVGLSTYPIAMGDYNNDDLVTLGVALKFGGFVMDATVSEDALRRGLGLIGGANNINTFGYVTLSYNFE